MNHIAKISGVSERPTISQTGAPSSEVVISFETVFGATGQLIIDKREYIALDPEQLQQRLDDAGELLNRPFMLAGR